MEFILLVIHVMECPFLSSNCLLNISWLGDQRLSCLCLQPHIILSLCNHFLRRFQLHFPWSLALNNPTMYLSSTYFAPFRILAPWLCWLKILCGVDFGDTRDWTSYVEQTLVTNERSLSKCAMPKAWSKSILLLLRSGLPSLDLGGSNLGANNIFH